MKKIKRKIVILSVIPLVAIVLIVIFRYEFFPSNEEILNSIKNSKGYVTDVEYTITNTKYKYTEEATINYTKGINTKIQFNNNIEKTYNEDGTMTINHNGYEYSTNSNNDIIYSLAIVNKIINSDDDPKAIANRESLTEEKDEWGEKEYLVLKYFMDSNNRNINSMILYIDKKDKVPVIAKLYDNENKERASIVYKSFKYI